MVGFTRSFQRTQHPANLSLTNLSTLNHLRSCPILSTGSRSRNTVILLHMYGVHKRIERDGKAMCITDIVSIIVIEVE